MTKWYAFTASEIALAEAIAASVLRAPDAIKSEIVQVVLETVKIPEVRSDLGKAAKTAGIDLPEDSGLFDAATGRTPRGVAIAAGWKRRNEAKAAAAEAAAVAVVAKEASSASSTEDVAPEVAKTTSAPTATRPAVSGNMRDPTIVTDASPPEPRAPFSVSRSILPAASRPGLHSATPPSGPVSKKEDPDDRD